MVVRWVSAAIVETEKQFRRVQGWRDIEKLVRALVVLEATEEALQSASPRISTGAAAQRRSTASGTISPNRLHLLFNLGTR